ncbi:uncharacterized protein LOC62_07G009170 [Vanrija pseudolonga]|uniref:Uncharacterized protein n=1 Tax=Vanrija pseudolonga TaxID=143232 RepID=A0AAF1BLC4_9TREE|nr:hypothetical protein LOC62_07G009170 [Vanrija pseudolonga]
MAARRVTVTQPIGDADDGRRPHLQWQVANGTRFTITGDLARFLDGEVPWHRIEGIDVLPLLQRLADLKEAYGANVAGEVVFEDLLTLPPDGIRADGHSKFRLQAARSHIWHKVSPARAHRAPLTANQVAACVVLALLKGWRVDEVPMTAGFPALFVFGQPCHPKERIYRFCYEIARDLDPANVIVHGLRCEGCVEHKIANCWSYTPFAPRLAGWRP